MQRPPILAFVKPTAGKPHTPRPQADWKSIVESFETLFGESQMTVREMEVEACAALKVAAGGNELDAAGSQDAVHNMKDNVGMELVVSILDTTLSFESKCE